MCMYGGSRKISETSSNRYELRVCIYECIQVGKTLGFTVTARESEALNRREFSQMIYSAAQSVRMGLSDTNVEKSRKNASVGNSK